MILSENVSNQVLESMGADEAILLMIEKSSYITQKKGVKKSSNV